MLLVSCYAVFPVLWGGKSDLSAVPGPERRAAIPFRPCSGFSLTAVVLPVLGVVVVARFDGLDQLGKQVGPRFALVFTVLIYLSIGPGLGIPQRRLRAL